jgi:hypothetical protein
MKFTSILPQHNEHVRGSHPTHVKLREGAVADTAQGQRVLDHIRGHADREGIAEIARLVQGFPAKKQRGTENGMWIDLRHMANQRSAGRSEQNKGLLELGWAT